MRLKSTNSAARISSRSGGELRQQGDGIVVQLPPADGVEVPKEVDHLGVPTPPQVSGQRDALLVQRLRCKSIGRHGFVHNIRNRFHLAHTRLAPPKGKRPWSNIFAIETTIIQQFGSQATQPAAGAGRLCGVAAKLSQPPRGRPSKRGWPPRKMPVVATSNLAYHAIFTAG